MSLYTHTQFFLLKGTADVLLSLKAKPVFTLEVGSFFGETALIEDQPRNAFVRATTRVEVLILAKTDFHEVMAGSSSLAEQIRTTMSHRAAPRAPPQVSTERSVARSQPQPAIKQAGVVRAGGSDRHERHRCLRV